jgi:putative ABC transport system permease protein
VLDTVRSTPGVGVAEGAVSGVVSVIDKSGKPLKKQAPTLAFNWFPERQLSALSLRSGRGPTTSTETTLDSGTAKSKHIGVGDTITIVTNQGPGQFTVTGITGFGSADNIAGATIVTFETATAQQLVGKPGYYTEVDVAAAKGTPPAELINNLSSGLPHGFEAVTGEAVAKENANNVNQFIGFFNTFLLTFAGIALFVGAFLIFNTFSILIGQRTRELGLLRALGASRSQVNRSVLGEALVVGLLGSILGLLIGVPLAVGLYHLLSALGITLPSSSLQLLPRTVIVSLVVGTLITVLSSIVPARRAAKIPPVAALQEDARLPPASLRRRAIIGCVVLGVGVLILAGGLFAHAGLAAVGLGAAVTFIGAAVLAPFVARPLARLIGSPLRAVTGHLAKENAARNPRRTAATASALMVGLALVTAIATLASSALASFNGIFNKAITADFVLVSSGGRGSGLSPAVEQAVRAAPGVQAVSPLRQVPFHLDGTKQVSGIDPAAGPQVFRFDMVTGSVDALAANEVLIDDKIAHSHHWKVGDTLPMGFPATGTQNVKVGGTYKTNQFVGDYAMSSQFIADNVNQVVDDSLFVKAPPTPGQKEALSQAMSGFPEVEVKTAAQFKADQKNQLNAILSIVYVLLALSILIALVGVVNTLALSVIERTREIGLMRAVGMQRRQVRAMVRGEAVVVALIGAVLGLVLGVALGAAVVSAISSTGITTLAIPVRTIIVVLVLSAFFGVVAAVGPARRAAKLDVLGAIATN